MSFTRNEFLKLVIGGGAAAAVGLPEIARAEMDFEGYPESNGVLVDLSRCIGCRACESACNRQNHLAPPVEPFESKKVFEKERLTDTEVFTVVNRHKTGQSEVFVKTQCMHCQEPACLSACPVNAFKKTPEGAVTWDESRCFGCRYCMQACPFWIPKYEFNKPITPRIRKCTMCFERIKEKGGMTACVEACPQEALQFGLRSELLKEASERMAHSRDYVEHIYGQFEVGGTSWLYISKIPFEQLGFRMDLGNTALPLLSYGFLRTIPILHTTLPIILAGIYMITRRRDAASANSREKGPQA